MPRQLKQIAKQKEDLNRSLELEREENSRLNRHIEEVKKAHHHSETRMSRQLKQIAKEKEDLLIRLSRIAGSKLTTNNPDIADLSNDNRPTKLAEKLGQLYDDAWTDSLEELTEIDTKLDDREAISFLLRIVMTAYQFCRGPCSMFLDLTDCQTVVTCKNSKDMTKFYVILRSIIHDITRKEKFCPSVSDKTNPWKLDEDEITQPPIHLSARVPDDGMMNNDIFKAYMKSGTEIDYIVWPVMYLHENGPLLTKGIAQPK
uniref:Mitochondria-eating protein C-terminal domain-containing protein n=1 Tax=Magallana gigas TaxID=29159 RepID=A0A8W8KNC7_MAGGI